MYTSVYSTCEFDPMPHRIIIDGTSIEFEVEDNEPVLDAALRNGVALPFDCQCGGCGTCRIQVLSGEVEYDLPPMALTQVEADAGFALSCQALARSDLVVRVEGLSQQAAPAAVRVQTRIAALERLCHDVLRVVLLPPPGQQLSYTAGQYLDVLLPDGARRSFSFASAPDAGVLDLHVRRVPGGRFTEALFASAKVGDVLQVEGPYGSFGLREDGQRPLLLVAGGTGLAPIKSLLESIVARGIDRPMRLYWGVRARRDLYLDDELRRLCARLPTLGYVPVFSEPEAGDEGGRVGFVHEAVVADMPDLSGYDAYLCGPPAMIAAAKSAFAARGLPLERMFADSFNFSHELDAPNLRRTA